MSEQTKTKKVSESKTTRKTARKTTRVSPAKKKLALEVIDRLKKEYPIAECTLDYENAWQLLVSVRLAAQCTDARVDQITPVLYERFPEVAALAAEIGRASGRERGGQYG
jgi:endonuclease-3